MDFSETAAPALSSLRILLRSKDLGVRPVHPFGSFAASPLRSRHWGFLPGKK
jgi:hypothetical protein